MFGGFKNLIGEDRINAPERLTNVARKSMIKYSVSVVESKRGRNLAVGLVGVGARGGDHGRRGQGKLHEKGRTGSGFKKSGRKANRKVLGHL